MSASKALGMSAGKAARRVGVAALAVLAALLVVSCEDDGGEGAIEVDLPAKHALGRGESQDRHAARPDRGRGL